MIATDLTCFDGQVPPAPGFRKAAEFLRRRDLAELADGTVELDGQSVFAIVQRYDTGKPEVPQFEFHRKYIDIQFIVSGREVIGWVPAERMTVTRPYDPEKDIAFGEAPEGRWTPVHLGPGQLAVLFPEDGHAPRLAHGAPSLVCKVVVKVAVEAAEE